MPVSDQSTSRIIEITHFSKDKKPNKLTIDSQPPPSLNENGFPEEGGYFLRIGGDAVFHLSEAEAAHLALTILEVHRQHSLQFMKIAEQRKRRERGGEGEDK